MLIIIMIHVPDQEDDEEACSCSLEDGVSISSV